LGSKGKKMDFTGQVVGQDSENPLKPTRPGYIYPKAPPQHE